MKKLIFFSLLIFLFNSCASFYNKETTVVKFSTNTNSKIIYQQDTLQVNRKKVKIKPLRSKTPLKITVLKDNLKRDFYLESKKSFWYWVNIPYNYGIGMLMDLTNDKRFTYQHNVHFITDSIRNQIVVSNKKIALLPRNKFFLYTSPLQFLDFFNEPMATLGTEYFPFDNISLSGEYGFRNSTFLNRDYNVSFLDDKASIFRIETKWYNGINLTNNVHLNEYLSIEYRLINSQYNDKITYSEKKSNPSNFITDDFATKKTVSIVNFKYGLLLPLGKQFYFDFYTGLGVRIKNFNYLNLEYDSQIHQIDYNDTLSLFDLREFKDYNQRSFLNYSLGFKFGFKL